MTNSNFNVRVNEESKIGESLEEKKESQIKKEARDDQRVQVG